jgi:cytochrome c biogenesis protein CcmG/thiol:disulfide interchange protein DsbE
VAVVVVVAIGVVTWIAIDGSQSAGPSATGTTTSTIPGQLGPATLAGAPRAGDAAPDFTLPPVNGKDPITLSELRGTPVVLNFWQSFCAPCREEFGLLRTADQNAHGRYAVVGVDVNDIRSDARGFMKDERAHWPSGYDVDKDVAGTYGVAGFPQTLFIAADGTIVARIAGPLTETSLAENLQKITR